jgi:hypothetical protein
MSEGVICNSALQITPISFRTVGAGKEQTIQYTDYMSRNVSTSLFYHEGAKTATAAGTFTRRIGNTVYRVGVHFSRTSRETIGDKITRLVKNDVSGKAANQ